MFFVCLYDERENLFEEEAARVELVFASPVGTVDARRVFALLGVFFVGVVSDLFFVLFGKFRHALVQSFRQSRSGFLIALDAPLTRGERLAIMLDDISGGETQRRTALFIGNDAVFTRDGAAIFDIAMRLAVLEPRHLGFTRKAVGAVFFGENAATVVFVGNEDDRENRAVPFKSPGLVIRSIFERGNGGCQSAFDGGGIGALRPYDGLTTEQILDIVFTGIPFQFRDFLVCRRDVAAFLAEVLRAAFLDGVEIRARQAFENFSRRMEVIVSAIVLRHRVGDELDILVAGPLGGDSGEMEVGVGVDKPIEEFLEVCVQTALFFGHGLRVIDDEQDIDSASRPRAEVLQFSGTYRFRKGRQRVFITSRTRYQCRCCRNDTTCRHQFIS